MQGINLLVVGMFGKRQVRYWLASAAFVLLAVTGASAQISLSSTVDLALQNSAQVKIAAADVQKATAGLAEAKDIYIPNLVTGAGLGPPSIGFPLGNPSLFNVQSQSLVYSFSQQDYIRASRAALSSAQLNLKDNRDQVTLDTALAYLQLDNDTQELAALEEEKTDTEKLVSIERERLIAGVDGRMELTKAEITSAQVDVNRLHLEDDADQQREKLAHLTGLPAASFITDPKSIPLPPNFSDDNALEAQVVNSNAGVQAAYANAKSKLELFFGDEKQNYRPQFGFGAQYSRFASFENYSTYYQHFSNNNFGAAVQITIPLFDATRRAKARESAADAAHANAEADQAKNQTREEVKSLSRSLAELKAQQNIAQLQSDLAQEQVETVQSELKNGSGSPNAAPVTPKDEQLARIQLQQRHTDVLNASLSLMRAQLSLMRSTGEIDGWVHSGVK
jgi:outer membrane protein TolC